MAFTPFSITTSDTDPQPDFLRIDKFIGTNQLATPSQIQDNESPEAINMSLDDMLAWDKRTGYTKVYATSLGTGAVNGVYNGLFGGKIIFTWGTGMYSQTGVAQPVSLITGLANAKSHFFVMNSKLYMTNGTDYIQYDGTTVVTVESVAYIPTTTIGRAPTGGGTAYEAVNYLQPGRRNSFIGNGTTAAFQLDTTVLDATAITATVNGVAMVETTNFTVNRTTGVVTFLVIPSNGAGVDNVVITFYKTVAGYAAKIKANNVQPVLFGGDNGTRVFFAKGNIRYHSGLLDPTYFPDNNYAAIGSNASSITGFSQQSSTQIILKESTSSDPTIWLSTYQLNASTGKVTFPVQPVNGVAGCDAIDSIQIIKNDPVFLDRQSGIWELTTSNVNDQRIVNRISDKINKSLLAEPNIQNAVSFVYNYRYGICVNNNAYIYDYRQDLWYGKWTNINASCFFVVNDSLYFGSSSTGMLYRFSEEYNDDGAAINAYVKTKYFNFGQNEYKKLLSRLFYSLKPSAKSSVKISFTTNVGTEPISLAQSVSRGDLFDYAFIDYSQFTFSTDAFPREFMRKVRVKKIVWVQFVFSNSVLNESMGVTSMTFQYINQNLVKDA